MLSLTTRANPTISETARLPPTTSRCMKVTTAATLAGSSYDFGPSNITKTRIGSMESYACYFPKGYGRAPGVESVPEPQANEVVIIEDFFATGLCMSLHLVLVDILRKF
jgi:hypothetical protein